DYVAELEDYVGPLNSRFTVVPSELYAVGGPSYIIPYPYAGPGVRVSGPFEVYALARLEELVRPGGRYPLAPVWGELLCVAVDGGLTVYGERIGEHAALWDAAKPECPGQWVP